ncbi:MAG: molybdopterin molybdotransferase MoeA [Alphaproteobacteria bacterium]|nr:molybdopterin molybdotransferase MoeA [Alphaproteobacteria bacterium]
MATPGFAIPKRPRMLSVEEARTAMLVQVAGLDGESIPLDDALGRILMQDVMATRDQPPFAVAAMDGYALIAADTPGRLTVVGESAAGIGFEGSCAQSHAIRISTGAALPPGTDAVVIQENVQRVGNVVTVPVAGVTQNVRSQGEDFLAGDLLLKRSSVLDGVALSLAAAAGVAEVVVVRRPRVAILSSGNELAVPGRTPEPWQIFDSATFGLAGLARTWGGMCQRLALERDDPAAIAAAAQRALRENDLLVVVGGASVGDHDYARPALASLGLRPVVEKVSVRPGKPTWFGTVAGKPVLGLPGNPASAFVCAQLFLKPMIGAMLRNVPQAQRRHARLRRALSANGPREHYMRAHWESDACGQLWITAFDDQGSSLISVFASSNALIRLMPGTPALAEGAVVEMVPLDRAQL